MVQMGVDRLIGASTLPYRASSCVSGVPGPGDHDATCIFHTPGRGELMSGHRSPSPPQVKWSWAFTAGGQTVQVLLAQSAGVTTSAPAPATARLNRRTNRPCSGDSRGIRSTSSWSSVGNPASSCSVRLSASAALKPPFGHRIGLQAGATRDDLLLLFDEIIPRTQRL